MRARKHSEPETLKQATVMLERLGVVLAKVEQVEAGRNKAITDANAIADAEMLPFVNEAADIRSKLEPWWAREGGALVGKRKSMTIGGCLIGTRKSRDVLSVGDSDAAAAALLKSRWGKALVRVSVYIDRPAVLNALQGARGTRLKDLGFSVKPGEEKFFAERAAKAGTLGGEG